MGDAVMEIYQLFTQEQRDTTGVQEVGMGRKTTGGVTATEALRLETNTRLRTALQSILLDAATVALMEVVWEVIAARMTPGQKVRILGERQGARVAQMTYICHAQAESAIPSQPPPAATPSTESHTRNRPILNHAVFLAFVGKADAPTADRNCVRSIVTFYGSALRERTETAA